MLFHVIAAIASVAFIAQGALAQQPDLQDVVNDMNQAATTAANTLSMLLDLTESSNLPQVQSSAQNLVEALDNITQRCQNFNSVIQVITPFVNCTDAATQSFINALSNVAEAVFDLVSAVNKEQSIFAQFVSLGSIATALEDLKVAIDSSAEFTIDVLPPCEGSIAIFDVDSFDENIGNAITAYNQYCIQSYFYPEGQPYCSTVIN